MNGRPAVGAFLRGRAPSLAVAGTTLAGLALVAPLEHAFGVALGLGDQHAWTVTALVEGAAGTAVVLGHYVRQALALTGGSVLIGSLWAAELQVRADHLRDPHLYPAATLLDDPVRGCLAVGAVVLFVAALALVHSVRRQEESKRAAAADAAAVKAREDDDRKHARDLELARLSAEQERARVAAEQAERDAQRRHGAELVRARAHDDHERERLRLDSERQRAREAREAEDAAQAREEARLERERLAERRAAADLERERIVRQREEAVKRRERQDADREEAVRRREAAERESREMLAGPSEDAGRHWRLLAQTDEAPDAESLAEIRGCALGTARNLISQWRRPHAVEAEA